MKRVSKMSWFLILVAAQLPIILFSGLGSNKSKAMPMFARK
jgi:hypothetical protein